MAAPNEDTISKTDLLARIIDLERRVIHLEQAARFSTSKRIGGS